MGARRKARELALQMLYEYDVSGTEPQEMFRRSDDLKNAPEGIQDFTRRLVSGTLLHREDLDALISRQADHWRLARMPVVDRNILRLALFELLHEPETPRPVVIDEALEIAKRFSTPKSSQFINGILDGVLKSRRGEVPRVVSGRRERRRRRSWPPARWRAPPPRCAADESAVYRASGPGRAAVRPVRQRRLLAGGGAAERRQPRAARARQRRPAREPRARSRRPAARDGALAASPERDAFARTLAGDAATQAEAVERILSGVASAVRYDPDRSRRQDPTSVFASRRAHCVGYSELAVDLLRRVGIAARTVQGILRSKPGSEGYDSRIGGVYHRWIEVYYPDRGFVFSDPSASINAVDARYVPFGRRALERPKDLTVVGVETSGRLDFPVLRLPEATLRVPDSDSERPASRADGNERGSRSRSLSLRTGSRAKVPAPVRLYSRRK